MAASLESRVANLAADAFVEFGSSEMTSDDILSLCSGCWLTDEAVAFATEKVQRLFLPDVRKRFSLFHPSYVKLQSSMSFEMLMLYLVCSAVQSFKLTGTDESQMHTCSSMPEAICFAPARIQLRPVYRSIRT